MKIAKFQFPDGRIGRFEVPDDYTPEQAQSEIEAHVFGPKPASVSKKIDPTEGMSGGEKLLVGIGKGFVDTGRGIKQLFNIGDQDQLRQTISEERKLSEPLMKSGYGQVGHFIGSAAATAPAMLIPGANTMVGGALIGAGMGAATPTLSDQEAMDSIGLGAIGGGAGVAAGRLLPSLANAFISPFLEKGREKIAGGVLRDFAGNDAEAIISKFKNPEIYVPGSTPSVAEVAMTPKMSTLQKAVRNLPEGKDAIVGQELNNNGARLSAIRDIAKDDAEIEAAKLQREAASAPLYDAAKSKTVEADKVLQELLARPSVKEAANRASRLANEKGETFVLGKNAPESQIQSGLLDAKGNPLMTTIPEQKAEYTGSGLHYLKMGLDDMLDRPLESGIGSHEASAIGGTKSELLNWLDSAIPEYGQARKTYAEMSRPINQMEIGQALKDKLVPALTENGLPTREKAAMFADAIRNQDALVKRTTGMRNKSLEDIMTPEQMSAINGIHKDLARKANSLDLAATRGSDTASNLIADNMLRSLIGPVGMPRSWMSNAAGSAILNSLPRRAVEAVVPSVEKKVQSILAEALADPKKAAKLMEQINKKGSLANWLYPALGPMGAYGALNAN